MKRDGESHRQREESIFYLFDRFLCLPPFCPWNKFLFNLLNLHITLLSTIIFSLFRFTKKYTLNCIDYFPWGPFNFISIYSQIESKENCCTPLIYKFKEVKKEYLKREKYFSALEWVLLYPSWLCFAARRARNGFYLLGR